MSHLSNRSIKFWQTIWAGILILIIAIIVLYSNLPLDGTTGDLQSFTSQGFLIKRVLEERENGLREGDIITHIEGYTIEELLHSSPDTEWRSKKSATYDILRDGKPHRLQIPLKPISFTKILQDWAIYQLAFIGHILIGALVIWKRPQDPAARWLMLFSMVSPLQGWADVYNFQPATLLWQSPFWFHVALEEISYSAVYASMLLFALSFPKPNQWMSRRPRLLPAGILIMGVATMSIAMALPSTRAESLALGDRVIVYPAMLHFAIAIIYSIYTMLTQKDPIILAQYRWILYGSSLAILVSFGGYGVPLALTGEPLISRRVMFLFSTTVPVALAVAILRYRLFDIEIIIKKSLVYISLTILLGIFYLFWVSIITHTIMPYTSLNRSLVGFIPTVSIALIFNSLRLWLQKKIDKLFFRSRIDYKLLLPEIITQLSQNIVLAELEQVLTVRIPHQLEISTASLNVFTAQERKQAALPKSIEALDKSAKTQKHQTELSIPLIIGKTHLQKEYSTKLIVGQYNLGQKLSERPYSKEEISLLKTLGQQVAVSIENARLYQEVENYNHTLEQKIQERTQELAKAKGIAENATSLLQTVMDNLDAYIYVGDMQTGEILFANQSMKEAYGDVQGKTCWKALYKNQSAPCLTCTNSLLLDNDGSPTGVHHREAQEGPAGHYYSTFSSAIRWLDGRMVRLAMRLDITNTKEAELLLHKQEHEIAREKERRKLARDLHDTLTQSLHSLVLMADTSKRLLEKERYTDLPASVQLLSVSARQALREMRLLLHELQLSEDAEINLQESLSTRLSIVENRVGVKTKLEIDGENHLSKEMRRELFYIATESLNNALKHANASQVSISIQADSTSVEMLIKDNGRGFGTKPLNKGMGFENMQFRAEKLNGKLQVISSPRDGTKIRLKIAF